jgi:hypothetical protein
MEERGYILGGDRKILQNLEDRNGLCHVVMKGLVGESLGDPFDAIHDIAIATLNVTAQ